MKRWMQRKWTLIIYRDENEDEDECNLDEQPKCDNVFELVEKDSFVANQMIIVSLFISRKSLTKATRKMAKLCMIGLVIQSSQVNGMFQQII